VPVDFVVGVATTEGSSLSGIERTISSFLLIP
jgi:hypothetical protein